MIHRTDKEQQNPTNTKEVSMYARFMRWSVIAKVLAMYRRAAFAFMMVTAVAAISGCALLTDLLAPPGSTITIDFNSYPGGVKVQSGNRMSLQYAPWGVTFTLADGTAPVIWADPVTVNPASPPFYLMPVNEWEDSYSCDKEDLFQDIILSFSRPVTRVSITALDADEWVALRGYTSDGQEIAVDSGQSCDTCAIPLGISVDGSQGYLTRVVIDVSEGNTSPSDCWGGPEGFDDLIFTRAP
jgi:hypothetical protein